MQIDPFLAQANPGGLLGSPLVMIILMIVMFYFLLIRPQKKQRQELEARIASLVKGDKVTTIGGIHAVVHHIGKDTITLKLSEGVFVPFNKAAIATVDKGGKNDPKALTAKETSESSEGK